MSAGLEPLGDDRIGAVFLQPARFRDRRRGAEDDAAGSLQAMDKAVFRQPEMEADDARLQLRDRIADFGISDVGAQHAIAEATQVPPAPGRPATLLGAFTPLYASPQQMRGDPPDPRDRPGKRPPPKFNWDAEDDEDDD